VGEIKQKYDIYLFEQAHGELFLFENVLIEYPFILKYTYCGVKKGNLYKRLALTPV